MSAQSFEGHHPKKSSVCISEENVLPWGHYWLLNSLLILGCQDHQYRLAEQTPCHTAESWSKVALIYFLSAILSYCFFFNLLECHCLTLFLCRNMKISVHLLRSLWSNKLCTDIIGCLKMQPKKDKLLYQTKICKNCSTVQWCYYCILRNINHVLFLCNHSKYITLPV